MDWFSKAGILYSDMLTTVSPTYANEIQTPEFGFDYEGLIRMKKEQGKIALFENLLCVSTILLNTLH